MGKGLSNVVAYAGWSPSVALVAIQRGWMGDCWIVRDSTRGDWVFRGAYVTDAQRTLLCDVYLHARKACDLREKCLAWGKAHPEHERAGCVYPEGLVQDLSSIDWEQGFADDALEDAVNSHPELLEWARSSPGSRRGLMSCLLAK